MTQPGWYPDPSDPLTIRFYDGVSWTHHVQPAPPAQPAPINVQQVGYQVPADPQYGTAHAAPLAAHQPLAPVAAGHPAPPPQQVQVNQVVMAPTKQKSAGLAVLLAFLFGPLGMLYSTVSGALTMFLVNLLFFWTLGIVYLITLPLGMVWAYIAANKTNEVGGLPTINVSQAPVAPQQYVPQPYLPQPPLPQQHLPQQHLPQQHLPQQHLPQQPALQPGNPVTEPIVVDPPNTAGTNPAQTNTPQRPDGRPYGDW
jgi:hypothetical protein